MPTDKYKYKTQREMLTESTAASESVRRHKRKSEDASASTIAMIQSAVLSSLGGAKLMGLPNLGPTRDSYNAVNVRAQKKDKKIWNDKPTLVIDRGGELTTVVFTEDEIEYGPADLSSLGGRDFMSVVDAYKYALAVHLEAAKAATERYKSVEMLAYFMAVAVAQHAKSVKFDQDWDDVETNGTPYPGQMLHNMEGNKCGLAVGQKQDPFECSHCSRTICTCFYAESLNSGDVCCHCWVKL